MQTRMDTCGRNFSIAFKITQNKWFCQFPWMYFLYPHSSFPTHHNVRIYAFQIHLCKSKILPVNFRCSSLPSVLSDPHDTKWSIISLVCTHTVGLDNLLLGKVFHRNTHGTRRQPQHSSQQELKDSHWYQGMHLGTEGRMSTTDRTPLDSRRIVLDLKAPLRGLHGYCSQTFDRSAGRNIQADSSTWGGKAT